MVNLSTEKQKIYEWASRNEEVKYCFSKPDSEQESYYTPYRGAESYLLNYDFETLPELRKLIETYSEKDIQLQDIQKVLLVAAMKGKVQVEDEKTIDTIKKQKELKEYIYVF